MCLCVCPSIEIRISEPILTILVPIDSECATGRQEGLRFLIHRPLGPHSELARPLPGDYFATQIKNDSKNLVVGVLEGADSESEVQFAMKCAEPPPRPPPTPSRGPFCHPDEEWP